jgi:mannose-6-phosphate isomerase-like protein (cupin superfamily)
MATIAARSFDQPDEVRTPDRTRIEVVRLGSQSAARITFQPGWRWSTSIKPVVGTESCQARHVGTIVSGRMRVVHDDGTEVEAGPGTVYVIEPGHDAWVVGEEPVVGFEFASAETYARP